MNLKQMLEIYNVHNANILWYGADICDEYIDDNELLFPYIEMKRMKPSDPEQVYLIMSGINKVTCRYRFAIKLTACQGGDNYKWEKVSIGLDEYSNRAIFKRDYGFSFYNNFTSAQDFILEEIWSQEIGRLVKPFSDYSSVELSYLELSEIIQNHYSDYYNALSTVKGIYMIIDGNTGKLYVGSAYGKEGIWGRWSSYAYSFHGENIELKALYNNYGEEYFKKFKYTILQILPKTISDKEVIEIESKYKKRFMTREFGLNDN